MRVLLDIGHPAHVHYFKNVIKLLEKDGHSIVVVAREKEITFELLNFYNVHFISRGKGKNSFIGKFFYLFTGTLRVFRIARRNRIDLYLSFASPYNAISSLFYRKPVVTFDDTEHNVFNHKIYVPLSTVVLTPDSFKKDFGKKHIRFRGTMDAAYLHPKYFIKKGVTTNANFDKISKKKKIILRLVSWNASHDINQKGFTNQNIIDLIAELSPFAEIYISSEKKLPVDLAKYHINIDPTDMHHYMERADLFIGESGSMATEASYLGTHSIVLNSASNQFGVFQWFSNYKTFYIAKNIADVFQMAKLLIQKNNLAFDARKESKLIVDESLCLTDFMVWFIDKYPKSAKVMKENPESQYKFKYSK